MQCGFNQLQNSLAGLGTLVDPGRSCPVLRHGDPLQHLVERGGQNEMCAGRYNRLSPNPGHPGSDRYYDRRLPLRYLSNDSSKFDCTE